jgi:hypothetical protein
VCLGASVVLFSFLYLLGKAGFWLCNRHQVVVRCVMHMRPGPAAIRLSCCAVASADLCALALVQVTAGRTACARLRVAALRAWRAWA